MAGYLSEAALAKVLAAVKGTTDTFMRQPIIFELRAPKLSAFTDARSETMAITEKQVLGLFVPGQQPVEVGTEGAVDLSDGYVLVNREDLAAVGLANLAGELAVNPAVDTVLIAGERYQLLAAVPLGPLDGKFTLGKFLTKKLLPANHA